MKLAVLVILGMLFLGGAGAGTYFFFMAPAEASIGEDGAHQDTRADAKAAKAKAAIKMTYVEVAPLMLPVIDRRGVSQTVTLVVVLEVADPLEAQKISEMMPRLTDAYIQDMYGTLAKDTAMRDGVVQIGVLKERLNMVTAKVVGEGVANDVLIQVVQQRRM